LQFQKLQCNQHYLPLNKLLKISLRTLLLTPMESTFKQLKKLKSKHKLCNKPLIWVYRLSINILPKEELNLLLYHNKRLKKMMVMKRLLRRLKPKWLQPNKL
jgi:hypothetical protein